jgi:hypothetical protein
MSHSVRIVRREKPLSGLLSVTMRCCDDPKTDSTVTIHQLHRSDDEILKQVEAHKAKVATLHAHDQRADELMQSLGAPAEDCGCRE